LKRHDSARKAKPQCPLANKRVLDLKRDLTRRPILVDRQSRGFVGHLDAGALDGADRQVGTLSSGPRFYLKLD
jgi:hypothetical protein